MQLLKDIILERIPTYESITEEQKQILINRISKTKSNEGCTLKNTDTDDNL